MQRQCHVRRVRIAVVGVIVADASAAESETGCDAIDVFSTIPHGGVTAAGACRLSLDKTRN